MTTFKRGHRELADQAEGQAALGKDSVTITRDQVLQWSLEGRLQHAQQGNAATKLSFSITTYNAVRPSFALLVPAGVMVIPISMKLTIEDLPGTENHILWDRSDNDIGIGTSTLLTISRLKTGGQHVSQCRARSIYTGDAVAGSNLIEIWRRFRPFASAAATDGWLPEDYAWDWDTGPCVTLLGPATISMHATQGGTAMQGFGEYVWAEFSDGQHPE